MKTSITRLNDILNQTFALLDEAYELVEPSGVEPKKEVVKMIGHAIGHLIHAQKYVFEADPSLRKHGRTS